MLLRGPASRPRSRGSSGRKKRLKKKKDAKVTPFASRCSPAWTEDGSGVKLADGVILSGRHAEPLIIPELASFLFIKKC